MELIMLLFILFNYFGFSKEDMIEIVKSFSFG